MNIPLIERSDLSGPHYGHRPDDRHRDDDNDGPLGFITDIIEPVF